MMRMRWTYVPPALYMAFALYVWIDFTRLAHDGLANLELLLATLPVTAAGLLLTLALGRTEFVLIPSGLGYTTAHAIYFWPAALLTAALLYGICSALKWLWQRVLRGAQLGRISTNGQELVEEHASELEAGQALKKIAAAKRQRGYRDL